MLVSTAPLVSPKFMGQGSITPRGPLMEQKDLGSSPGWLQFPHLYSGAACSPSLLEAVARTQGGRG